HRSPHRGAVPAGRAQRAWTRSVRRDDDLRRARPASRASSRCPRRGDFHEPQPDSDRPTLPPRRRIDRLAGRLRRRARPEGGAASARGRARLTPSTAPPPAGRLFTLSVGDESLAHPPLVDDVLAAVARQLAAEARGMRVERPGPTERPVAPDLAQQLFLREDAIRVGGELQQELVLPAGERDALARDGDAP